MVEALEGFAPPEHQAMLPYGTEFWSRDIMTRGKANHPFWEVREGSPTRWSCVIIAHGQFADVLRCERGAQILTHEEYLGGHEDYLGGQNCQ